MYDVTRVLGGTSIATFPVTGFSVVWWVLAAFTLISAGTAVLRLLPARRPLAG